MNPRLLVSAFVALLSACSNPLELDCTEMGCGDGLSVSLRSHDGSLAAGTYSLLVRVDDGALVRCEIVLADTSGAQYHTALCDETSVHFSLSPQTHCVTEEHDDAVSQSCTPIADRWDFSIGVSGTPRSLRFQLLHDESVLTFQSLVPEYSTFYPNGEECGGACRQASARYTF